MTPSSSLLSSGFKWVLIYTLYICGGGWPVLCRTGSRSTAAGSPGRGRWLEPAAPSSPGPRWGTGRRLGGTPPGWEPELQGAHRVTARLDRFSTRSRLLNSVRSKHICKRTTSSQRVEGICLSLIAVKNWIITVGFGGDPQGGGALPRPHVVVGDDPEAVALLGLQVGHHELQRLGLRHVHWPLPGAGDDNVNVCTLPPSRGLLRQLDHRPATRPTKEANNQSCNLCNPALTAANPGITAPAVSSTRTNLQITAETAVHVLTAPLNTHYCMLCSLQNYCNRVI